MRNLSGILPPPGGFIGPGLGPSIVLDNFLCFLVCMCLCENGWELFSLLFGMLVCCVGIWTELAEDTAGRLEVVPASPSSTESIRFVAWAEVAPARCSAMPPCPTPSNKVGLRRQWAFPLQ